MSPDDVEGVRRLVLAYRDLIAEATAHPQIVSEAKAELATLSAQVDSPKPKRVVITESLRTLRSLLENFTAGVGTQVVLDHFSLFGM